MLTITRISAISPKVASTLKIVHVTDIHFEMKTSLTEKILVAIKRENPDLIFVTGDIHQLGKYDKSQFGDFLSRLCSIAPTYGVTGFDDELALNEGSFGKLHLVNDSGAALSIRGTAVHIKGLRASKRPQANSLSLVLMHSPDGIPRAARERRLVLCRPYPRGTSASSILGRDSDSSQYRQAI